MRSFKLTRGRLLATVLVAALSSLIVAAPAQASPQGAYSDWFVDGAGALTDDWGDHYGELGHSLCYGCADSWNTDLVVLWQSVLHVDGYLADYDIDGKFGAKTRDATKKWQSARGLSADGLVGNATWSKADNNLFWDTYGGYVYYLGRYGEIILHRGTGAFGEGAYQFRGIDKSNGDIDVSFDASVWDARIEFFKKTWTVYP